MGTSLETLFYLTLFATFVPMLLSIVNYRRSSSREFLHLTEFWCSFFILILLEFSLGQKDFYWSALCMAGWLWPLKCFSRLLEDITGTKLIERWHYLVLGIGTFSTLALSSYSHSFLLFTLPFTLSILVVGIDLVAKSILKTKISASALDWMTFLLMTIFLMNRMTFIFRKIYPEVSNLGPVIDLLVIIGFSSLTLGLVIEHAKEKHEKELAKTIKERSEKLFGQSKYYDLGMMSAGVAHEINNPLAIIQAKTTQLIRIVGRPEKQKELKEGLNQILNTSERINRTIQGVREFVHQDERMPDTNIEVKDLMEDVLAFCSQRMKNHGVNLRFYGLDNHIVRGHKIQLEQVILNLFNNAFDAIEFLPDKWIEVSVQSVGVKVQIFVKDSGTGIAPEVSAHMMEPFFTTKEMGRGTGLGLALAKGIIEKHGGELTYIPHLSHTTFLIELPSGEIDMPLPKQRSATDQFYH